MCSSINRERRAGKRKDALMQGKYDVQIWYSNTTGNMGDERNEKGMGLLAFIIVLWRPSFNLSETPMPR